MGACNCISKDAGKNDSVLNTDKYGFLGTLIENINNK
jgi:shikimate 5-dehydrogenase